MQWYHKSWVSSNLAGGTLLPPREVASVAICIDLKIVATLFSCFIEFYGGSERDFVAKTAHFRGMATSPREKPVANLSKQAEMATIRPRKPRKKAAKA
jgi:hypothetical protein